MALSGLQIYKLLPQTNCKECGFPTCLAFAMKLAQKGTELAKCPYVTDETRVALDAAAAPPIRLVTVGTGERAFAVGNETVLFRHEKTFVHQTALLVRVHDDDADLVEAAKLAAGYAVERVGMTLTLDGLVIENRSGAAATFAKAVAAVHEACPGAPLVLKSDDPAAVIEIHDAAAAGDLNKVKALLEADPTLLESKDDRDQGNLKDNTPLISACWGPGSNNWQATVASFLVDKGANVNAQNKSGATPLYFATKDFDLTQRLLTKGAEVNIRAFGDFTSLHQTAASGNLKVAKLLIDHGADPNANGSAGTVLQFMIRSSRPNEQMARLLVENGARLNQKSNLGNTELHLAVLKGSADWTRKGPHRLRLPSTSRPNWPSL